MTAWLDMPVGNECSPSPQELVAFVAERGRPAADGDRVITFEGRATIYRDGPLLLYHGTPTRVVETLTWERVHRPPPLQLVLGSSLDVHISAVAVGGLVGWVCPIPEAGPGR
ncbi:hypothetical protein JCM4814A_03490 [Streptomyces phaeofaciens JCM 4814]|uniref:Uncharacterized protein n=1 Tax=Streptomyces phaeofaciens TaxID=68254 RepID=A0A918HQV4_9ACTN|nr:hypothetical protein GCM10010226_88820 [Streptomyces phaeofaciens]